MYTFQHQYYVYILTNKKKGMKKTLENHTQVQRVDFIIKKYEEWRRK